MVVLGKHRAGLPYDTMQICSAGCDNDSDDDDDHVDDGEDDDGDDDDGEDEVSDQC